MAYITNLDLSRQAKLKEGKTANLDGSINLGEDLIIKRKLFLEGLKPSGLEKYALILDSTGEVQLELLSDIGGGGNGGVPGTGGSSTLKWRGQWEENRTYERNDMVGYDGSTWIYNYGSASLSILSDPDAIPPIVGNEPKEGSVYWFLLAKGGDTGEDGVNHGKSYEIIFKGIDEEVTPAIPVAPINDPSLDDNIPDGWTDDLISPTSSQSFVYASKRTKTDNVWSAYGTPVLWGVYVRPGMNGMDGTDYQYIYKQYNEEIENMDPPYSSTEDKLDDDFVPAGWTSDQQGVSGDFKYEYVSKRVKSGGTDVWSDFTRPVIWARYAGDGADGKDGKNIEYIFKRVETQVEGDTLPVPIADNVDDALPVDGTWFDDPQGVTEEMPFEYVSFRTKVDGQPWTQFSKPAPWAKYSFDGQDGIDGRDYEYIFKRTRNSTKPPVPENPIDRTIDDYIPTDPDPDGNVWTDNAVGVNGEFPYEWMCQRVKVSKIINGVKTAEWSDFTSPSLWGRWGADGADGKDGTDYEFIFKLVKLSTDPAVQTPPPSNPSVDDDIPAGWTDDPTGVSLEFPLEYHCQRKKIEGVWSDYTTPALWAKFSMDGKDGKDGKDIEYVYKRVATIEEGDTLSETRPVKQISDNSDENVPAGWTDDPQGVNSTLRYEYVSSRDKIEGIWGDYSYPSLWSTFALDGKPGEDGEFFEYIYKVTETSIAPTPPNEPADTTLDDYIPDGWTDDPLDVTEQYQYQWVCQRVKNKRTEGGTIISTWSHYTSPKLWSRWGADGADGKDIEFVYKRFQTRAAGDASEITQNVNVDGHEPEGWTDNATGVDVMFAYEFIAKRTKINGVWGPWGKPVLWAKFGHDGKDGTDIEFIYKRVQSQAEGDALGRPISDPLIDEYIPDSTWTDEPQGVDNIWILEYTSKREKGIDKTWGLFTPPALWARYSADGIDGIDGKSVEYIFKRVATENDADLLPIPTAANEDEALPSDGTWSDDPQGVTAILRYECVSQRKKINGDWSVFSKPSIWARYSYDGEKGKDGRDIEFIYKRTEGLDLPANPNNPADRTIDDFIPTGWTDDPLNVSEENPFEWQSQRERNYTKAGIFYDTWSDFTIPVLWSKWGKDGIDGQDGKDVEFIFKLSNDQFFSTTPEYNNVDDQVPTGWTDDPTGVSGNALYEFMSKRVKDGTGVWSQWTPPALWSKWAADGLDGKDGKDIEFIYKLSTVSTITVGEYPRNIKTDDYVDTERGWTDDPQGVSALYNYEFVAIRRKIDNIWTDWDLPKVWAKFGMNGEDGKDIEFVYLLTETQTKPVTPVIHTHFTYEEYQVDEFVPQQPNVWTDDPSSMTITKPFQWMMRRIKENDIWQPFSEPALYGKPGPIGPGGEDGNPGDTIVKRYGKSSNWQVPPAGFVNTDPNPSMYTLEPPFVGALEYLWQIEGRIDYKNTLIGTWTNPVRISPVDGIDGDNGTPGIQGPFLSYRGVYDYTNGVSTPGKTYYGGTDRVEVVTHNGVHYITLKDAGSFSSIPPTGHAQSTAKWQTFQGNFESVATDVLFAQLAYIKNLGVEHLKTSETGKRIEIDGGENTLKFFESSDNNNALITIDDDIAYGKMAQYNPDEGTFNLGTVPGIRIGKDTGATLGDDSLTLSSESITLKKPRTLGVPNSGDIFYVGRDSTGVTEMFLNGDANIRGRVRAGAITAYGKVDIQGGGNGLHIYGTNKVNMAMGVGPSYDWYIGVTNIVDNSSIGWKIDGYYYKFVNGILVGRYS